jgi:type III secretion protein Q
VSELAAPRRSAAVAGRPRGAAASLHHAARLPRLSTAMLRAANMAFSRDEPLAFKVQGGEYEFRWLPRQRQFSPDCVLRLRIGMRPAWLALENAGVFDRLGGLAMAQLPVVLRNVLVSEVAGSVLAGIEPCLGAAIQLVDAHRQWSVPVADTRLHFHVRNRSTGSVCWGFFQPDHADTLDQVACAWAAAGKSSPRSLGRIPVTVRLEIGKVRLTVAQFAQLETGDALRCATGDTLRPLPVRLRVAGLPDLDVGGSTAATQITITEVRNRVMKTDENPLPSEPGAPVLDVDSLPVTVAFDLGQRQMTIAELKALRSGCTLELDRSLDQSVVRLLANGAPFGSGQLVAVGEMLCVRITELADLDRD